MLFEVDGKIESLEGATEARELIVRRALEYLDGLAGEADDDPELGAGAGDGVHEDRRDPGQPARGRTWAARATALASYAKAQAASWMGSWRPGHGDVATRWVLVRALFGIAQPALGAGRGRADARQRPRGG